MKQAVMTEPGVIELRDVTAPVPGPCEVLLRIKRIGVCGVKPRFGGKSMIRYAIGTGGTLI